MDKYVQFKHILEYFVAHLEWVQNNNKSGKGYIQYIDPLIVSNQFNITGQGYNGNSIQRGIDRWQDFDEGTVCINVSDHFGQKNFRTKACYLNWKDTGVNVISNWMNGHIVSLEIVNYIYWVVPRHWEQGILRMKLDELGLFDGTDNANDNIVLFFKKFSELLKMNTTMTNNQTYINALYANRNIIFNGAPGTGKTYLAKGIAAQMICNEIYTPELEEDVTFKSHCKFVQFHQSYDYTDFVEGLRPIKDAHGNIAFERCDGIFKEFCKEAINELSANNNRSKAGNTTPYVFIIDEINRGEMSKIFGELFFSIDPGYRGKKGTIRTQYQNLIEPSDIFYTGFYVPENVYIIGTMNDIDRSVESMDFAMRRRFAFLEISAEKNIGMLEDIEGKDEVLERMNAINSIISSEEELGSPYHIGGAYFRNVDFCRKQDQSIDWEYFWNTYLRGLVYEYLRGFQDKDTLYQKMKTAVVCGA